MTKNELLKIENDLLRKENEALKCRCKSLGQGLLCEFCPLKCRFRQQEFRGPSKEMI